MAVESSPRSAARVPAGAASLPASPADGVDLRLVDELQCDARLSFAELGRRVGLSPPAVAERVARLERAGVITGYRAVVDPARLGYPVSALVRISLLGVSATKAVQRAEAMPEVTACYRATGSDCVVLLIRARSVEHLGELLDAYAAFGQVTTSVILASPIAGRAFTAHTAKNAGSGRATRARNRTGVTQSASLAPRDGGPVVRRQARVSITSTAPNDRRGPASRRRMGC